ncbi:hypothetical protein [Ktedonobacter robiniae]|uniref:Uncharacterized protein n=1 Tax=Ktedonobacter robiniae TaxID=2778365 RepID=A0ABQ3V279_9CHLR|nr:hypothetical protein [Ktedonobacter robiniae]GHO58877.1 hypothetical protein KSB_73520 [Ktedonobacter robiniae]
MTSRSDFTAEEWKLICHAPLSVGGAVAAASPSGLVGSIKEGTTIVNSMRQAADRHRDSQLVQDIMPKGIGRDQIESWTNTARSALSQSNAQRLRDQSIEECRQVSSILQTKGTPQEAQSFKLWLLEVGQDVANAATEKGNIAGQNISPQETQVLHDVANALNIPER